MYSHEGTCLPSAGSVPLCATASPRALRPALHTIYYASSTSATSCWPRASCPPTPSQVQAAHSRGTNKSPPRARAWDERGPRPQCSGTWEAPPSEIRAHSPAICLRKLGLSELHARHGVLWAEMPAGSGVMGLVPAGLATHSGASEPCGRAFPTGESPGLGPWGSEWDGPGIRPELIPALHQGPLRRPPRCPRVYSTAYYALIEPRAHATRGRLPPFTGPGRRRPGCHRHCPQPGLPPVFTTVGKPPALPRAQTGPPGNAAKAQTHQVCLSLPGSAEKRAYLQSRFPQLNENQLCQLPGHIL